MKGVQKYKKIILMLFSETILIRSNWVVFGPKMACPHNSGSTLIIFIKFFTMKLVKRYIKTIIFQKNSSFGQIGHFVLKNDASS